MKMSNGEECGVKEENLGPQFDLDQREAEMLDSLQASYHERCELIKHHFDGVAQRISTDLHDTYHEFFEGGYCIVRPMPDGPRIVFSRVTQAWFFQPMRTWYAESPPFSNLLEYNPTDLYRLPILARGGKRLKMLDGHDDAVYHEWLGLPLNVAECKERRLNNLTRSFEEQCAVAKQYFQHLRNLMQPGDAYRYYTRRIKGTTNRGFQQLGECVVRPGSDGMVVLFSKELPGWHPISSQSQDSPAPFQ